MERDKIKNDLLNADFTEVQSETLSYLFAQMATKEDLRELRSEMHSEFRVVRSELGGEIRSVRTELLAAIDRSAAEFREEVARVGERTAQSIGDLKDRLLTVALGVIGAMAVLFTAIEFFLD